MKFHAEVGENKHELELRREGRKVFARIDDREYELEVSQPEAGLFHFKKDGKVFEIYIADRQPGTFTATTLDGDLDIKLIDPKRLRGSGALEHDAHGAAEIRSAMPGKVVRILTSVGTAVEKGDGVIVVEAMKMQNELKAPKAGSVKEIRVAEGDTVNAGDVLVIIE
jgi:biotin carboxyl carrier protein